MFTLKAVVEALLFASQKPLALKEIAGALRSAAESFEDDDPKAALSRASEAEIADSLLLLQNEYSELSRSFQLVEQVSGWVLVSRIEFQIWVRQLFPAMRPARLSAPALETLAIIAYRQPITKADVEAIRGVTVDGVMQKLLDAGLVKIAGRADIPGRPLLYETTLHFMEHFGLKTLEELPNAFELRQISLSNVAGTTERRPPLSVEASDRSDSKTENIQNGAIQIVTGTDSEAN